MLYATLLILTLSLLLFFGIIIPFLKQRKAKLFNFSNKDEPHHFKLLRKQLSNSLSCKPYDTSILTVHNPNTFKEIRNLHLDESLALSFSKPFKPRKSEGKSSSSFLETSDNLYLIKTLKASQELNTLKLFLFNYFEHIKKFKHTLLPIFYGLYTFKKPGYEFSFVVLKNLFPKKFVLSSKFDFKGSNLGRKALHYNSLEAKINYIPSVIDEENTSNTENDLFCQNEQTLKELDFKLLFDHGKQNKFKLGQINKDKLLTQLKIDVDFLKANNLIDYSFLVGVYREKKPMNSYQKTLAKFLSNINEKYKLLSNNKRHTVHFPSLAALKSLSKSKLSKEIQKKNSMSSITENENILTETSLLLSTKRLNNGGSSFDFSNKKTPAYISNKLEVDLEKGFNRENYSKQETKSYGSVCIESQPFHKSFEGGMKSVDFSNDEMVMFEEEGEILYEIYFVGLIDILQTYDFSKKLERTLKRQKLFSDQLYNNSNGSFKFKKKRSVASISSVPKSVLGVFKKETTESNEDDYETARLPHFNNIRRNSAAPAPTCSGDLRKSVVKKNSHVIFDKKKRHSENSFWKSFEFKLEPSVEEPDRYGERLKNFIDEVFC
ncbi:Phosphatidylinositol 4-phosphate 5-kinase 9 [Clydaea vesicula]|uniref:Phosphatidylinositol 4-phosphate 5-kinase 9 n=1 Tax=Clydaea vesicula TaxID=447962 RepID=A0AAD5XZ22_9FUNG|nr:Phosphatidylinositol 4-phosphate 5-kinase 9 [Clydaea vesicula]KAJ3390416.1 Phosphatidylinositol 4-phosphate 5-kinase 9 [Lobulomyces angularis]